MRFQFTAATFLLAITAGAIALGGGLAGWRGLIDDDAKATLPRLLQVLVFVSPWWIPLAFATYCLGRGRLTAKATAVFAVLEATGVGGMLWLLSA